MRRTTFREQLANAKRANDFYADMAGKPRLETHPVLEKAPVHRTRDPNRITEAQVNDMIREYMAQRPELVLWRNNRGEVVLPQGRLRYGVGPNGASDWIGYREVLITQEMVGQSIARFVAVEAKAPDGELSDSQDRFLTRVENAGGRALVVRERKDIEKL